MAACPAITSQPPQYVATELTNLNTALDGSIPAKRAGNLLIATWNIRAFSSLTEKWTATSSDSPKRDLRGLLAIAQIISRFDVVAIQEVMGDLKALMTLMDYLGDEWSFLMTDVNVGTEGNNERMAFVFNRPRAQASGLCCELVVTPEWLAPGDEYPLKTQFVRTPYAASFRSAIGSFVLVTLHVDWVSTDNPAGRIPELYGIAAWMANWARRENTWNPNLITLGDFNIDRADSDLWWAFASTGLTVPANLDDAPRTVFDVPGSSEGSSFYDQIAWFDSVPGVPSLTLPYLDSGYFDFRRYVYTELNLSNMSVSFRLSDHFPMWIEFGS